MPRRIKVDSLVTICINNICVNMESFWYERYWKDIYSSPDRLISEVGPFEYLPGHLLNEITAKLKSNGVVLEHIMSSLITPTLVKFALPITCDGGRLIFDLISLKCQDTLKELTLSSCDVENGCLMKAIESLVRLEVLNLDHTDIDDGVLAVVGSHCSELRSLSLNGCYWVTDVGMEYLFVNESTGDGVHRDGKCHKLESLSMELTRIREFGLEIVLRNAPKMKNLNHRDLVSALGRMHQNDLEADLVLHRYNLTSLYAGDCDSEGFLATNSHANSLSVAARVCPYVTDVILMVYRNAEREDVLRPLSQLKYLKNLEIECSGGKLADFLFSEVVSVLCVRGQFIKRLHLVGFSRADVGIIGLCCPLLEDLRFSTSDTYCVEDSGRETFIPTANKRRSFTFLKYLNVSIGGSGFRERREDLDIRPSQWKDLLSSRLLESLTIRRSYSLTDGILSEVFKDGQEFPNLRKLDLMLCHSITAHFVKSFLDLQNPLEVIYVRCCMNLTKWDFESFKSLLGTNGFDVDVTFDG